MKYDISSISMSFHPWEGFTNSGRSDFWWAYIEGKEPHDKLKFRI